jgi:YidC/Oxa1 family membrane protein insertase
MTGKGIHLVDIFSFGPIAGIMGGAYALVTALGDILAPVFGTAAAAAAIVLLTLLVRAALIPVGVSQARATLTRQRLAPKLAELQRKHGKDRERLQRETMALYAAEKASPFAGCLPLLLQAPVLSIVYALFLHPSINGQANALLAQHLGGVPLGTGLVQLLGAASGAVWPSIGVFVIVLGAIAAVAAVSRRVLAVAPVAPTATASAGQTATTATLSRVLSYLPFITVVFAAFVPLAAALYLLTTTTWTLAERLILRRVIGGATPPSESRIAAA